MQGLMGLTRRLFDLPQAAKDGVDAAQSALARGWVATAAGVPPLFACGLLAAGNNRVCAALGVACLTTHPPVLPLGPARQVQQPGTRQAQLHTGGRPARCQGKPRAGQRCCAMQLRELRCHGATLHSLNQPAHPAAMLLPLPTLTTRRRASRFGWSVRLATHLARLSHFLLPEWPHSLPLHTPTTCRRASHLVWSVRLATRARPRPCTAPTSGRPRRCCRVGALHALGLLDNPWHSPACWCALQHRSSWYRGVEGGKPAARNPWPCTVQPCIQRVGGVRDAHSCSMQAAAGGAGAATARLHRSTAPGSSPHVDATQHAIPVHTQAGGRRRRRVSSGCWAWRAC